MTDYFREAAEVLVSRMKKPTGRPDSARSASRGAGMMRLRVGVSGGITMEPETEPDDAGPREGDIWADPNRLLYTDEVCRLIDGMTPNTWRSYVSRGYAPAPDDPDLGRPVNRRTPRWKLSTVADWQHTRVRRKKRNPPTSTEGGDGG